MNSVEIKEKVIRLLDVGISKEKINESMEIPMEVLTEWENECKKRNEIKSLIEENRLEEARILANELTDPDSESAKLTFLIKIAAKQGNQIERKQLLERKLELDENDFDTMRNLVRIARTEGNLEEEERLLKRQLKLRPRDIKIVDGLLEIAKKKGNVSEQKRMLQKLLTLKPNDIGLINTLIKIYKSEGNKVMQVKWLERSLELNPRNQKAKNELRKLKNEVILESTKHEKDSTGDLVAAARALIYSGEPFAKSAEKINELLAGVDETNRQFVIAELYYQAGLTTRAENSLKMYKGSLNAKSQGEDLKRVNQMLEMIKSNKTRNFEWNEFWGEVEEEKRSKTIENRTKRAKKERLQKNEEEQKKDNEEEER